MSLWDLFKPRGDTIAKTVDSVGDFAKDIRTAITGDIPPEKRADLIAKYMDIQKDIVSYQRDIITTEMQGSWLQRNWRPMLAFMLVLIIGINYLFLPILGWFGLKLQPITIPNQLWTLLTVSIGGYVGGRSIEKITSNLKK